MPRRNIVVESTRQWRIRILRLEQADVLNPLLDQMDANRAQYNDLLDQMHKVQRRIESVQREARDLAARIDEVRRYYAQEVNIFDSWPQDRQAEPIAPLQPRFNDRRANREFDGEWEPTMPSVLCFVDRHPHGTRRHLVAECQQFRLLSVSDRALFFRRPNLCFGCWLPRRYENGRLHDSNTCEHPQSCYSCGSRRHHTALCGAPLVMDSTLEEARQARLMRDHY
jgi:hypothetical protein